MNCSVAAPSHNPGCFSKGDKSSPSIVSFQKQTSLVTFHAREVMIACPSLRSSRFQLPDIEEVIANSPGKRSCCFHVWHPHSECQLSQRHIGQPHPVSKQGWANSTGPTWLWQSLMPGIWQQHRSPWLAQISTRGPRTPLEPSPSVVPSLLWEPELAQPVLGACPAVEQGPASSLCPASTYT